MDILSFGLASSNKKRLGVVEGILPNKADLVDGGIVIPSGNTADRPVLDGNTRSIRFNTDLGGLEEWNGTTWKNISADISAVRLKGTDTEANILAMVSMIAEDLWIASDTLNGWVYDGTNWVNIGPLQGPDGVQGVAGATWLTGATDPVAEGVDNDLYLNTTSYDYFKKVEGVWQLVGNLKGDTGDAGDAGNGITQITFTSTTHASGSAGQSGGVDTYTISYTNGTSDTFTLINGVDGQESLLESIEVTVDSPAATYTINVDTTSGSFEVFLNGLKLASTDYTLTGTSVVINVPVDVNDLVVVKKLHTFSVLDTYSQSVIDSKIVNERSNAVTLTGKTIDSISNTVGADHVHYKVRNNTGAPLVKGTLVKAAGSQPGTDYIVVEPTTSTEDVAIGVVHSTIDGTTGWVGLVVHTGEITGTNTSAWVVGTILYTGAGGNWTTVKPTSGTYQASGYVLRQHTSKGTVLVEFSEPAKIYSEEVQTSSTTTKYVDSVTAVNYKLYLENGNIVMEEL